VRLTDPDTVSSALFDVPTKRVESDGATASRTAARPLTRRLDEHDRTARASVQMCVGKMARQRAILHDVAAEGDILSVLSLDACGIRT
jgi:hypothetical protein